MIKVETSKKFEHNKPSYIERHRKIAVEMFEKIGHSNHSGMGMLLPFIINHCEENKIQYILKAAPGQGYYIEKANWV